MSGADLHGALLGYLDAHRASLLLSGLLSGLGVFVLAFLFSAMGAFPIVFALVRLFYECTKFLLCALTLLVLIFWFDPGVNFWLEGGAPVAVGLYAWLCGAAFGMQRIDFNYPIRDTLLRYGALYALSLALLLAAEIFL